MKTFEQKLRHVMEAASECVHEKQINGPSLPQRYHCKNCGKDWSDCFFPSPDDLNELFRLAKKLRLYVEVDMDINGLFAVGVCKKGVFNYEGGEQLGEALLNALFIATGGVE